MISRNQILNPLEVSNKPFMYYVCVCIRSNQSAVPISGFDCNGCPMSPILSCFLALQNSNTFVSIPRCCQSNSRQMPYNNIVVVACGNQLLGAATEANASSRPSDVIGTEQTTKISRIKFVVHFTDLFT